MINRFLLAGLLVLAVGFRTPLFAADEAHPPIPIRFTMPQPGAVTLVVEDSAGKRVRNPFEVWTG